MKILKKIEGLIKKDDSLQLQRIWLASLDIIKDVKNHNKNIITQLEGFDVHDKDHSEEVINIIENLLGEKINDLSFYELLLIYMSSYMHDAAMALPSWEYKLLEVIEEPNQIFNNELDVKSIYRYSEAEMIIRQNSEKLYENFDTIKDYIFSEEEEEELIKNLVDLMKEYQEFRNGYINEIEKYKGSTSEYNKSIRSEYIRSTHHIRIEKYVKRIQKKYRNYIRSIYSQVIAEDLSKICKSHGEEMDYIYKLDINRNVNKYLTANIQFISILLRLGDIIHFNSDRAPKSLFAEMNIKNEDSKKHWKAKIDSEIEYIFDNNNDDNRIYIKYLAKCSSPDIYYFIQNYIDGIDNEISNYYEWYEKSIKKDNSNINKYELNIGKKVNREYVKYDEKIFIPGNLKFTLNQSKILELLMGIQLYQDKYLCLREIYQNALDASKCMLAYNKTKNITEQLEIEFGLKEEKLFGKNYKYIYCHDKGIGMDKHIVENYLLNIGNSYYKSKDFNRNNIQWNKGVNPTSQFGIGILSGYMIADKIGIITKYYEKDSELISFILEGSNENSYYIEPNEKDRDKIDSHGTIIKLYLKEDISYHINNIKINELPLFITYKSTGFIESFTDINKYENNLSYLINSIIGIEHKDIPVYIQNEENRESLITKVSLFDTIKYLNSEDVIKKLGTEGCNFLYDKEVKRKNNFEDYIIQIKTESLEVYSHMSLPKRGVEINCLDERECMFNGGNERKIFVDGVFISDSDIYEFQSIESDIRKRSIFNFIGEKRPLLSVDRNTIISMPDIEDELNIIRDKYFTQIVNLVCDHIEKNDIKFNDREIDIILDILIEEFNFNISNILNKLNETKMSQILVTKEIWKGKHTKLEDLYECKSIQINNCDFRKYKEIDIQLILSRALCAESIEVKNRDVNIICDKLITGFPNINCYNFICAPYYIICAKKWDGVLSEYDLVSSIWPIVNTNLYKCIRPQFIKNVNDNITEEEVEGSFDIDRIVQIDPVLVNPKIGISYYEPIEYENNCVGKIGSSLGTFELIELDNRPKDVYDKEEKFGNVLFVYISPRCLNDKEEITLQEYKGKDDDYVKGVKEGWSILFLGAIRKAIILPGVRKKQELIDNIPDDYIGEMQGIRYYNTDGTELIFE